jgi:single-strand DNA-binding protein
VLTFQTARETKERTINNFKITGNLTADPDLRFGNSGKAYVRLRVAESRGEGKDSNFYNVTAFETLAENIADSLHKGDRVVIDGYFDSARLYETDNGAGEKRIALDVIANEVTPSLRFSTAVVTRNVAVNNAPSTPPQYEDEEAPF